MRITDPRNANGDKLLSVREITNRYKRIIKTIPSAGESLGVVVLTSDDIDEGRSITDYAVLSTTVLTKSEGLVNFQPLVTTVHEHGEDTIHLRFFDEVSSTTDLVSFETTITLEDARNVIATNVDATSLSEEMRNRAEEIAALYTVINSVSSSVPFGSSLIEDVNCDSAECVLTFGETRTTERGYEYVHDGNWFNLVSSGDSLECRVNFALYDGTKPSVRTFFVVIDLRGKTESPNIILPDNVHWTSTAPSFTNGTYTVMKFTQIGSNVIMGENLLSF